MNMKNDPDELLPTRWTLIERLKNWDDQESWRQFFETYWKLIYGVAIKSGLTHSEAQDVVQETVISVLKSLPKFEYDAEKGSFKTWLLRLTSWRVLDQLRKRQRHIEPRAATRTSTRTATIERVTDPVGMKLEAAWDDEWERNLMEAAIERVKRKVDPRQYQAFDLCVVREWSAARVARALKVNRGRVYLIKHRINNLIKKELAYLQAKPI